MAGVNLECTGVSTADGRTGDEETNGVAAAAAVPVSATDCDIAVQPKLQPVAAVVAAGCDNVKKQLNVEDDRSGGRRVLTTVAP